MTILKIMAVGILVYLIWAYVYHRRHKSLFLHIFIEYVLTAALVLILLVGVLL